MKDHSRITRPTNGCVELNPGACKLVSTSYKLFKGTLDEKPGVGVRHGELLLHKTESGM